MYLIFDTETTNLPNDKLPPDHPEQARVCQLAFLMLDDQFKRVAQYCSLIKPDGWVIGAGAFKAHGISQEECEEYGVPIEEAYNIFAHLVDRAEMLVAHNIKFDIKLLSIEAALLNKPHLFADVIKQCCTMTATTNLCKLPGKYPGSYKWPKLHEAYSVLLKKELKGAHDAMVDVNATAEILQWLIENKSIQTK